MMFLFLRRVSDNGVNMVATAVSFLTERNGRPLPLEPVLGKTLNCTWGMGLAPHTPKFARSVNEKKYSQSAP